MRRPAVEVQYNPGMTLLEVTDRVVNLAKHRSEVVIVFVAAIPLP